MRETWYEVKRYRYGKDSSWIVPITVVKETEKTVTVEETGYASGAVRERRHQKDNSLFRTKVEAEAEVTRRLSDVFRQAEADLDRAKAEFEKWFLRA